MQAVFYGYNYKIVKSNNFCRGGGFKTPFNNLDGFLLDGSWHF